MKTFMTGATGFIGGRLAGELSRRGGELVVLRREGPVCPVSGLPGVETVTGDILDLRSLETAMAGCGSVYHLAGYAKNWANDPATFTRVNVDGLCNILEAARRSGVRRVVWTSSAVTPGPSNGTPVTESTLREHSFYTPYEASKYAAEQRVREFTGSGLEVVTVNPSRVFGPGVLNEGNSVTRMIALTLAGRFRFIPGDGEAVGNYAFVEDVVNGMILAMEHGRPGERYILGGENVSYNEFFRTVSLVSGRRRKMFHLPRGLAMTFSRFEEFRSVLGGHPLITPGWMRTFLGNWEVSVEKSRRELGYETTPFADAVGKTVRWLSDLRKRGGSK